MLLSDLFSAEYSPLRRLSQKTINCYEVTFRHFGRYLGGPPKLEHLADLPVARFLAARERETCRATAARDRVQLLALWRYAARKRLPGPEGKPLEWPEVPLIRAPSRTPVAYTSTDVAALIREARRMPGEIHGTPAGVWWSSLLLVAWESGERIAALMALQWREVDLPGRRITFRAETRKNQTRDISRQISPMTADLLASRSRVSIHRVWPWNRSYSVLWTRLKGIARRAGVEYRGFHGIRRASVSYVEAACPGAGQRFADHSSPSITQKSYLDPRIVPQGPSAPDILPKLDLPLDP
jgi:integrase